MKVQNEVKKAPMVLMEDNLTKAKRALMVPKVPCPNAGSVQELEAKAQLASADRSAILKFRETIIKKRREYHKGFPKFKGDSKQGKDWCLTICYHALDYNLETISADDAL